MTRQIVLLSLVTACLTLNSTVSATDRLVPSEYSTIQAAIDAAQPGDTVILSKGIYRGVGNKNLDFRGKAITVQSTDLEDPCVVAATVIDCENSGRGFYFTSGEEANSVLSGFTIKRGKVTGRPGAGGGIYCSGSSPTIENCVIANNHVYGTSGSYSNKHGGDACGGGIYFSSSNTSLNRCTFISNISEGGVGRTLYQANAYSGDGGNVAGGGIYCEPNSPVTVRNCIFQGNRVRGGDGGDGGDYEVGPDPGDFITVHPGDGGDAYGGGIYCGENSPVQIIGCSVHGNEAIRGNKGEGYEGDDGISRGGGVYGGAGIENSIIWANIASSLLQIYGDPEVSYSDVEGGWIGEGNIDADPCFLDPAGGDCHLLFDSPCVNAGDPGYGPVPGETDIDGDNRIIDGRIDMGADEFNPEIPFLEISPDTFEFEAIENGPDPMPQILSVSNSEGGVLTWVITEECNWLEAYPNNGQCTDEVNEVALNIDISGLDVGFYNCELTVDADGALNRPQIAIATLRIYGEEGVLKVPSEYGTIQSAIDVARPGDTVMVAEGTYTGSGNKNLDFRGKAITVRSVDPEDPVVVASTVIDCENSGRAFYFHSGEEANSVLAGLTIQRGRVYGNPAKGGGIYCSGSSPTIKNCVIISNQALGSYGDPHGKNAYGGGVYCESNSCLTLIDCTFSNNTARGGFGDDLWCSPMSGCSGGLGSGGDGYGGGIYSSGDSRLKIVDCIISDNSASGGQGGVYYETGGPIEGASGGWAWGGGVYCGSAATVINNCSIVSNTATGGNGGQVNDPYAFDGERGMVFGGGVCGKITISNSIISSNYIFPGTGEVIVPKSGGGGICCTASSSIVNCLISDNSITSAFFSTGIHLLFDGNHSIIKGCTILNNTADYYPPPYAVDDVFHEYSVSATITDSIIWGHGGRDVDVSEVVCSITHSCIEQNVSGPGNIHDNPRFVTGPLSNHYLSQIAAGQAVDSPCVDAGSDTAANLGMHIYTTRTDEVGDKGIVDMGYHHSISPDSPDIDGDGDIDFFDYAWLSLYLFFETSKQIPRGSVVVDGDLSDWPGSVEWIELDKIYWGSSDDVMDARFALQWDDETNKVYAAVIVNDTNHVFTDEYVNWDASDRIEVYSQGDAEGGTAWSGIYDAAQQYYVAPDSIGGSWATWALGEVLGEDVGLEYFVSVIGNFIIYEVGVPMFDNYGEFSGTETLVTDLHAGHVVGFDIVACTRWNTVNFGMLSENLMMGKYNDAGKFGKYILVDEIFSADLDGNGARNYADLDILFENWPGCYVTKAVGPNPADNATRVDPKVKLSWWPGGGAMDHDVYFGTSADTVANADHASPEFMGTVSDAKFGPLSLNLETMYYWRIDEVGLACMIRGEVWSFTTGLPFNFPLAGQWKFDEGGGSIAYDSAGDNDGTIYGATWTSGKFNGALSFDGANDYIDCGNDASLDPDSGPFAVSAWFKTNVTNEYFDMIVSHMGSEFTFPSILIYTSDSNIEVLIFDNTGNGAGIVGTTNIEDGNWHYIVVVRDTSNLYLYVDGVCEGTPADATSVGDVVGPGPWTIGALNWGEGAMDNFFNGIIDEVAIYK